jgi:hypothetical protein
MSGMRHANPQASRLETILMDVGEVVLEELVLELVLEELVLEVVL